MGGSAVKNNKRIYSLTGGDPSLATRVTTLENNEYKITYFAEISSSTGSITIPTGATILLDQLQGGVDAYVCTIQNGQPTGNFPQTSGGVTVDVTSFNSLGAYTLSGTPSSYPVALIYILKIKAKDYSNLDITKILDLEDINIEGQLALKADKSNTALSTYLEIPEQSKPGTPTNAARIYVDSSNRLSWIGENGYVRTFDGTANTADRTYTLPNISGTISLKDSVSVPIGWTANTNLAASTTYYIGYLSGIAPTTSSGANRRFRSPITGNYVNFGFIVNLVAASAGANTTIQLHNLTKGTSVNITTTMTWSVNNYFYSGFTLQADEGDVMEMRFVTGAFSTAPTTTQLSGTLTIQST